MNFEYIRDLNLPSFNIKYNNYDNDTETILKTSIDLLLKTYIRSNKNEYLEILNLKEKFDSRHKLKDKVSKLDFIQIIQDLANRFYSIDLYLPSLNLYKESLKLKIRSKKNNDSIIETMNKIMQIYVIIKQYDKAKVIYLNAIELKKNNLF